MNMTIKQYLDPKLNYQPLWYTPKEISQLQGTLIPVPDQAELAVQWGCSDLVSFYLQQDQTVMMLENAQIRTTEWPSVQDVYQYAIQNPLEVKLLWKREPAPELTDFSQQRSATQIAQTSLKHIQERAVTYDSSTGERSALKTAIAFNAITGKNLSEAEVFLLLQLLKDVRQWQKNDYHQDSAEDCIAYAALKAEALELQHYVWKL